MNAPFHHTNPKNELSSINERFNDTSIESCLFYRIFTRRGIIWRENAKRILNEGRWFDTPAVLFLYLYASHALSASPFRWTLHAHVCSASSRPTYPGIDSLHEERRPRRFLKPDYDRNIVALFATRPTIYSRPGLSLARFFDSNFS